MKNVLVLASGGIDSTACIYFYISRGFSVRTLHVDYGQKAYKPEKIALVHVCDYFDITYSSFRCHGIRWSIADSNEIIGRNLMLASIALANFDSAHGLIAMGIHSGSGYADCSVEFQQHLSVLARLSSRYRIDFDFPFGSWIKRDIVSFCKEHEVPVRLTYSCEDSDASACGRCQSCIERNEFMDERGILYGS